MVGSWNKMKKKLNLLLKLALFPSMFLLLTLPGQVVVVLAALGEWNKIVCAVVSQG